MTTIQMITNDQVLIGVTKPKVASGDVNSVTLQVEFDAAWDGFLSKSACFHTAKDATVHEVLLTEGECLIPASVLDEEGILFIGVRGVSVDGEAIKTSTLVKYKVVAGATAGTKTIYPEMDMYQQYLAAIKAEVSPIVEAYAAALNEQVKEYYEELKANAGIGFVLWENEDITAAFEPQTIPLDLTEYNKIKIILYEPYIEYDVSIKNVSYYMLGVHSQSDTMQYRKVTVTDSGVTFDQCYSSGLNTGYTFPNQCVPVKIIGYKY